MAVRAKIEKSCPAFTAQTAGWILMNLHRKDKYQVYFCMPLTCLASLHKIDAIANHDLDD
jgi:hypothetical protein